MNKVLMQLSNALYSLANGAGGASASTNTRTPTGFEKILLFVVKLLKNAVNAVVNLLITLMFTIAKLVLNIVDFLSLAVKELAGQSIVEDISSNKALGESDMVFRFLYDSGIRRIFRAFIGIGIILIIVFAVVAIIKKEYENFLNGDSEGSNKKVFVRMLSGLFLIILVPVLTLGGIILSDSLLGTVDKALNRGGGNVTFATQVFSASTYESNKYRLYAIEDDRIPITFNFEATSPADLTLPDTDNATNDKMNQDMAEYLNKSVFSKGLATWWLFQKERFYSFEQIENLSAVENAGNEELAKDINLWKQIYDVGMENISRIDYFVMADVVDYMLRNRNTLNVVNAYDLLRNGVFYDVGEDVSLYENCVMGSGNAWPVIKVEEKENTYKFRVYYNYDLASCDAAINKQDGLGRFYKEFTFNSSRDEKYGACYLLCNSAWDENNTQKFSFFLNNSSAVSKNSSYFYSDYLMPSQPVVARGCFSSNGYPTAIREVGSKIEFYREEADAPSLTDFLPKITYETQKGHTNLAIGLNMVVETITGLDMSELIPKVYFRNELFTLFTKGETIAATLEAKELFLDYNFNRGISVYNVESVKDINIIVLLFASIMLVSVLFKVVFGLIARIFDLVLLFITYPAIAATIPLDNGKRFKSWVETFIGKLFAAYGIVIGFNLIIILSKVVANFGMLFSVESISNDLQGWGLPAHELSVLFNYGVWLMFFLVLFTLFKSAASFINGIMLPKTEDIVSTGGKVTQDISTAIKKTGSVVSGKIVLDKAKQLGGDVLGFVPGSAVLVEKLKKKKEQKGIDKLAKKAAEQRTTLETGTEAEIEKMNKKNS